MAYFRLNILLSGKILTEKTQIIQSKSMKLFFSMRMEKDVQVITLNKNDPKHAAEYKRVEDRFKDKLNFTTQVVKIERVQNKKLWKKYFYAKYLMKKKYENVPNAKYIEEVEYFHGTRYTPPETIYTSTEGIDRR
jgi:GTPase involved in cell partitioning and DNA repair